MSLIQTIKQLYWTVTEQTVPANPDSGDQRLYIDSADHKLKRVNSSGTVVSIEAGGAGSDTTAIHDNVAGEISAVTEKGTPIDADLLLIEDSADSNNKKRVQIGNLPGGTGGAGSHMIWDNPPASAHANDDEFNGSIDAKWGGWKSSGAPNNVTTTNGLLQFDLPTGAGKACMLYQTPPAGDWTITTKCFMNQINEDARPIIFQGVSGGTVRVLCMRDWIQASGVGLSYEVWTHNASGAWTVSVAAQNTATLCQGWQWLRMAWDSANTTIHMLVSYDGFCWLKFAVSTGAAASDVFGIGGLRNGAGTNQPHLMFDYFRCLGAFSPFASANGETIDFTA